MEKIAVERSIWIDASMQRAWRAVTEAEQLSKWYATNYDWEIPKLAVGATVKFHNSDTEILLATIEVLDPPYEFVLRWHMEPEMITTFLLKEVNGGTQVTIHETGYELMSSEERDPWFEQAGAGYTMSMENLKAHLEGRELPH
jgi:uncharacterized protein YndB with AHSA1/START domain